MNAVLQGVNPPQGATVSIHIEVTAQFNITPFVAQQLVNQRGKMEVSSQLKAGTPRLVVGTRMCWGVPVLMTSPAKGIMGSVGELLVDVETGEVLADTQILQGIAGNAARLAQVSLL